MSDTCIQKPNSKLSDIYVSPEAIRDIKNWSVDENMDYYQYANDSIIGNLWSLTAIKHDFDLGCME